MNKKNPTTKLTYQQSGVNYGQIDPFKILAQKAARLTAKNLKTTNYKEVRQSRGESAYVLDMGDFYLASITECLGTKILVADDVYKQTGKSFYYNIAQDTIAMAVNDILTVGAMPISIHAYWAAGNSDWFSDKTKIKDLIKGWKKVCDLSGAAWGGGETPILKGVVKKNTVDLAASCLGIIKPKKNLTLGSKLQAGDHIITLASSGIHANGLSLARLIAKKLKKGYQTKLNSRQTYGEALLASTSIYTPAIKAFFDQNIDIHYISNITGHGFRKIMRHKKNLTYRITNLPPVPEVLEFMVQAGSLDQKEVYASLNMGAGMVIFIPQNEIKKTLAISKKNGVKAYDIGLVETGPKQVIIEPLNIIYKGESLNLRI